MKSLVCVYVHPERLSFISPTLNMTMEVLPIVNFSSGVLVVGLFQQAFIKPLVCHPHALPARQPRDMQIGVMCRLCSSKIYRIPSIWRLEAGQ